MILKKNDLEKLNNIKPEEEISSIIQETGKLLSLSEQKLNKNCSLKTDLEQIKQWLDKIVNSMSNQTIKSIVGNHHFLDNFNATFNF